MTHDLAPGFHYFYNFFTIKIQKHVLSKSCSELALKPNSKKVSDMTHGSQLLTFLVF